MAAPIGLHLEFRGGAELLFNGTKEQHVKLPSQSEQWDVRQLLVWIKTNLLKERPELFIQGDTVAYRVASSVQCSSFEETIKSLPSVRQAFRLKDPSSIPGL
ncbi:ubiquitin-related modifier 1 isoform X2 [Callorhinchus milii]|uniref:ubiquitin-related modifier 1 isoform X2 n=1 Tax=Callorhinchus milii TaxID=7868 RepID=UPI001C3FBD32|nr:ubiquitin-related modifier 1 isoform X2 [Callorhinchus milii]